MPSPVSQITTLVRALSNAPTLKGWMGIRVIGGRRGLALQGAPPRIVIFPATGEIRSAREMDTAIRDVDRVLLAHLWAADLDQMEELEARFFQAFEYQASPEPSNPVPTLPIGQYWKANSEEWNTDSDANTQGEEVLISLTAIHSIDRVPPSLGLVSSTAISTLTTTLAAPLGASDTSATVASTLGFPTSGVLTIDAEQIRFTGTTATTFTGLVRGVNSTTPSSHSSGATVSEVPIDT